MEKDDRFRFTFLKTLLCVKDFEFNDEGYKAVTFRRGQMYMWRYIEDYERDFYKKDGGDGECEVVFLNDQECLHYLSDDDVLEFFE